MGKFNLTEFIDATKQVVSKHSPEILTGIGIGGMIVSTVLAVQSTPKAMRLIEEERERKMLFLTSLMLIGRNVKNSLIMNVLIVEENLKI